MRTIEDKQNNQRIPEILVAWLEQHFSQRQLLIFMAFLVGVMTAIASWLLKSLIEGIKHVLTNSFDVTQMNWLYLVYPVIGIFLTALFIKYIVRDDIGHGVAKILFAISRRQGHIKKHNCWSSVIGSSITIGFGGSVGAESPAVLTGSAIGSTLGNLFRVDQKTLMVLIGCGASGAIAGIFKAPFAGLVFTLEVLMLDLTMASLLPLLVSCVTSAVLTYSFSGMSSMFTFHSVDAFTVERVVPTIFLGIFCGLISWYFTWASNRIEDVFRRTQGLYRKLALGGIVLSILIFLFPPLYGEGYDSIELLLTGNAYELLNKSLFYGHSSMLIPMLSLIILTKVLASAATTGGGGCGGLFAPSLFLGGLGGFVFSTLWNEVDFAMDVPTTHFALLGMAGVMAAVMHAPLTSIFLIAELTGGYGMLVPLMIVAVSAYLTIVVFEPHSIYATRLAKKGQLITHHKDRAILTLMSMDTIIDKCCMRIHPDMDLGKLTLLIAKEKAYAFPVVDGLGNLCGMIYLNNIRNIVFRQELYHVFTAQQLMENPPSLLSIDDAMPKVMDRFQRTKADVLPVLDSDGKFLGLIYQNRLYSAYRQMLVDFSEE